MTGTFSPGSSGLWPTGLDRPASLSCLPSFTIRPGRTRSALPQDPFPRNSVGAHVYEKDEHHT